MMEEPRDRAALSSASQQLLHILSQDILEQDNDDVLGQLTKREDNNTKTKRITCSMFMSTSSIFSNMFYQFL